jgi:transcriptional regulator GlxA family with amidase domain
MAEQGGAVHLVPDGRVPDGLGLAGQEQAVAVVSRAIDYFARWYASPIDIPSMACSLGVSLDTLEGSFARFRGRTTHEALIQFRLNRLCDAISADPGGLLTAQAEACGFPSVHQANRAFLANYCQDLVQYRNQCLRAAAWRSSHPRTSTQLA